MTIIKGTKYFYQSTSFNLVIYWGQFGCSLFSVNLSFIILRVELTDDYIVASTSSDELNAEPQGRIR